MAGSPQITRNATGPQGIRAESGATGGSSARAVSRTGRVPLVRYLLRQGRSRSGDAKRPTLAFPRWSVGTSCAHGDAGWQRIVCNPLFSTRTPADCARRGGDASEARAGHFAVFSEVPLDLSTTVLIIAYRCT
jgi:hypothetical protein